MATLDEALQNQALYNVLQAPTVTTNGVVVDDVVQSTATSSTLNIQLNNTTTSSTVYAYITGLAINNNNAVFLLQSDGKTAYYPSSPSNNGTALAENCSILLGAPGTTTTVTIPQLAGGRIWFCIGAKLSFFVNPGPGLVEPSVTNTSDPNYYLSWDFCEFTYNSVELFANISYVDFVCLPIALTLVNTSNETQTVDGLPTGGLATVCSDLTAQTAKDGASWSSLIVKDKSGNNLRALSPNSALVMNNSLFTNYFQPYVTLVWQKYESASLSVDTQAQWGVVAGKVSNNDLSFGSVGSFPQPSTADIFSCSTGAFGSYPNNTAEMGNITARLAAAFNRSTLLIDALQPDDEVVADYYQYPITNHYARILHTVNPDGMGYAFPYDDVAASTATNVAGTVSDGSPQTFTVTVGGSANTSTRRVKLRDMARTGGHAAQQFGDRRIVRRALDWSGPTAEDEKALLMQRDAAEMAQIDIERGDHARITTKQDAGLLAPTSTTHARIPSPATALVARALRDLVPAPVRRRAGALAARVAASPAYAYARPMVDALMRCLVALLSLSLQPVAARALVLLGLLLGSFLLGLAGQMSSSSAAGAVAVPEAVLAATDIVPFAVAAPVLVDGVGVGAGVGVDGVDVGVDGVEKDDVAALGDMARFGEGVPF